MAQIASRNTGPEIRVRQAAHAMGLRYRLHRRDLPGTPDIVFPKLKVAVFVHGCFWHRHEGCRMAAVPKTRPDFWAVKFAGNIARDQRKSLNIAAAGWREVVVWECETKDRAALAGIIRQRVLGLPPDQGTSGNSSATQPAGR